MPRPTVLWIAASLTLLAGRAHAAAPTIRPPATIVAELCSTCHGQNLTGGGVGPNLLDFLSNHGNDDASVRQSITRGWPENGMPPFESILAPAEIDGLVAHLRAQRREFAAGRIVVPPPPATLTRQSERQAFRVESLVDGLNTPWGIAFLPDGRMLVSEREGNLRFIAGGRLDPQPVRGLPRIFVRQDGGLLDVTLHPDFARNGWVYLAYSETGDAPNRTMTVVIRGRIRDHAWVDQQELFRAAPDYYVADDYSHYGCRFLWDPSGNLFFSIGDRGRAADAQDLGSPLGKIHRIRDDGTIPPDNPFVGRAGAMPSIWSYGNRHVQGLQFHPVTGKLWATEHGPRGGDELNRIDPGRNYGWPVISMGRAQAKEKIEGTERAGMEAPAAWWTPSLAPSGIDFYTGDKLPGWKHHLLVACLGGEQLRRIETDGDRVVHQEMLFRGMGRVRDVVTGPDGYVYLALNNPGRIARIVPVDPADVPPPPPPWVPPAATVQPRTN